MKVKPFLFAMICLFVYACAGSNNKPIQGIEDLNVPVVESFVDDGEVPFDGRVQVIAFNIERGFFWQDVVRYIEEKRAEVPATVVLISEADRNHSRTGDVFVALEMARALKMNMVFATEYIEYNDKTPDNQGDHGNAILSPFPLEEISVIRHTTVYSWTEHGHKFGQPRKGERVAIGANVVLPDGRRLRVYTVHFESNAVSSKRLVQMDEVLEDADPWEIPVAIGGDFNEMPLGFIFMRMKNYGFKNTFAWNLQPTGTCKPAGDRAMCLLKIDWIVHRDMEVIERKVDYPLNSEGGVLSDHAPVRAVYKLD